MQKNIISFANIDEKLFDKVVPTQRGIHLAIYIEIYDEPSHVVVSHVDLKNKKNVKEVMDGDIGYNHISLGREKEKMKSKKIKGYPHLTLVPQNFSYGVIEYNVRSRGFSQSFAKVRAVFTLDLKDKEKHYVNGFMSSVIKLKLLDIGNCFRASSQSHLQYI